MGRVPVLALIHGPTLAELAQDPRRVAELPAEAVPVLLGELEALKAALWGRVVAPRTPDPSPANVRPVEPPGIGELLTVPEAAEYLRCSPATIRKWLTQGKLRRKKAGRLTRVAKQDLDSLIAGTLVTAQPRLRAA
jgi:excisionase family DNA binding protein